MYNSKVCFKCGVEKPLSDFYKHKEMGDGFLNKCKECAKKDTRENRAEKIDYYKEYDRSRASNPNRVAKRKEYSLTDAGKKVSIAAKKKWVENNKIKRAAHLLYSNYIRHHKEEIKHNCESCGATTKLHAHHSDYHKPLDVLYLCPKCHTKWHKENGEGIISK